VAEQKKPKNWQDTPQGKKLLRQCAKNTDKLAQELKDANGVVFDLPRGVAIPLTNQPKETE
jgi:hypothetical protein